MLDVKYAGFGGYMEVPCYEDENGKLYFDENNGIGGLNLYTGAYRDEFGDILGESDKKVTEDVRCAEPFARHTRENDYRMLGRLKQDCEYFLGYGAGNEDALYYKNVAAHCDAMEKLWNSFSEADKPEWLCMLFGIPYEAKYQGTGTGSAIHVYNEEGEEVLTYTGGVGWQEKETKAESQVHSALKMTYYEAFSEARKALNSEEKTGSVGENIILQDNFDMKA